MAARVAGGTDLLDIRAVEIRAELLGGADAESPYDVGVSIEPSFSIESASSDPEAGQLLLYSLWYDVEIRPVGGDEPVATVGCRYNAAYHWRHEDTPSDDELRAFGETTVLLALYPYVRQLVHDMTGRFNLDPLVMPLYKEPLKAPGEGPQVSPKKASASKSRVPRTVSEERKTSTPAKKAPQRRRKA